MILSFSEKFLAVEESFPAKKLFVNLPIVQLPPLRPFLIAFWSKVVELFWLQDFQPPEAKYQAKWRLRVVFDVSKWRLRLKPVDQSPVNNYNDN